MAYFKVFLLSLFIAGSCYAAEAPASAQGPGRTRPLPDTMAAQHKLQIRKTSRWIQQDETSAALEVEKAKVLGKKRKILIRELEKAVKTATEEPKKLDLNLRLGRLYIEDYYAAMNASFEKYEQAMEKYQAEKNHKGKKAPRLSQAGANVQLNKAYALFSVLKKKYGKDRRADEILYSYALTSLDKKKEKAAMDAFQEIVDKMTRSRFTPDALAQLGDFYLREHQVEKAEGYFDKILKRRLAPLITYALYKKAWCEYTLEHHETALKLFAKVIDEERSGKAEVGVRVRNEALADITLLFVELNLVERSISFFRGFEEPIYRRGVETMAELYLEKGAYQSAIDLWENLIQSDSGHPKNPLYEVRVAETLFQKGDMEAGVSRLSRRTPLYLEDSDWQGKNKKDAAVVQTGVAALETLFRTQAIRFHDTAQKMNQVAYYGYAKSLYTWYLDLFPKFPEANRMRFHLAKIHFKQGEYLAAADQYARVFEMEGKTKGSMKKDALVQALASLSKEMTVHPQQNVAPAKGKGKEALEDEEVGNAVEYGQAEEKFLALSASYLKEYPDAKDVTDVLYERGYLMYRHRDFDKALLVFKQILDGNKKHPTATSAAHLSLDVFNRRKDYPALISAAEAFIRMDFGNTKFKSEVEEILRRAELKVVENLEKDEKYAQAAEGYLHYCDKYGIQDASLHEKALYNAGVQYTKAEKYQSALETNEKFLRTFPKSKLTPTIKLSVARSHEWMGEPALAAKHYAEYAQANPKSKETKNAVQLAAWNYWAAGDLVKAEKWFDQYLELYPTDPSAEANLVAFFESQGLDDSLVKFQRRARARKGIGPLEFADRTVKLAELVAKQSPREAERLLQEASDTTKGNERAFRKHARGVEILSKLALWELQDRERAYFQIRLNKSSTLEANLTKKVERLKELEKEYAHVSALGNEEMGLAAIYRTARAYANMAQEAANAPTPPTLAAKDLETYQKEIKKVMVTPFQEKALRFAQRCLEDSEGLRLYSKWTSKCYGLAAEINAEKYPSVRTFYVPSLRTAVFAPDAKRSKISLGSPDGLTASFPSIAASVLDNVAGEGPGLYAGSEDPEDVSFSSQDPQAFDYSLLADSRRKQVEREVASEAPGKGDTPTFSYLNFLRLKNATEGVRAIRDALRIDPMNSSLQNLLAVSYLDEGNTAAAQTIWLGLIGRGEKNGAILNNLGVVSLIRGKESQAIAYFNEARSLEEGGEAAVNLGYLALKYRNGPVAKEIFEEVRQKGDSASADVGVLVAQMQAGDLDDLRENLVSLTRRHATDGYARLGVAYFLIDIERDYALASKILNDYLEQGEMKEPGGHFQRALREAARGMNEEVASLAAPRADD